ncbi:hypothetical protein BT96DRAFT_393444 [Gymnopus androsaceus JB14]|uniref:Uncharacterized protein n=1 Tax=Gymnopus androsaceus JB14 TaxID=1447944 RepID=A0A6A4GW47_9AGAR|nr:hypothetical protein BT96DRAFT_393444 [Gymnopus androsaceus JB14]
MIENKETDNVDFVEGGAVSSISRDQSPQPFSSIETLGSSASQTSSSGAIELSPSSASQTPGFGLDLALPGSEHPTPFSPSAFNLCLPGEMQQSYNFNPNSVEPNSFQQQNQLPSSSTSVIPSRGLFDLLSGSQPHHQPSSSGQITLNGANDLLLSQRNQMTVLEQSMDLVDSKIDEIDQWIHGPGPLATGTEFNEADGGYSNTSSGLDAPSSDMPTMDSTVDELFGPYTFPSPVGGGVNYGNDGTMDVSFINPVILSEKSSALVPSPEHATTSHAGLGNTSTSAQKRNLDAGEPSSPKAKRRKG